MVERANITPKVLKWARETANISEAAAAAKVSVKVEKLQEWEKDVSQPTIRQAKLLSKAYQRSFAILFLPEIPRDFQPLQDFRKSGSAPLSTSSIFIIREIQQKQTWISEENKDNGMKKLPFVGMFSLSDKPKIIANHILEMLQIVPLNYTTQNPIKEWIEKAENNGIFISRTSYIHSYLTLDKEEIQGFAIADPYAPFVFINSDDWNAPQLFTLVHELAHIWIASTGISNHIAPEIINRKKYHPVELFCNEVTANALMPENYILDLDREVFTSSKLVFKTAKQLGVSSFALLVRAFNLDKISKSNYFKLKMEADSDFEEFLIKEVEKKEKLKQKDAPIYYPLKLNRNGRLFTQIVLDAYNGGRIEPNLASLLLNVKSNNFHKLEEQMYRWSR